MRGVFYAWNLAVAGQQRWLLTTRAAWQLIQLLRCREAIAFRLLVDDLRRRAAARVLHGRFRGAWLLITCRAAVARLFATGLAITRCAVTRTIALGRWGAGGGAVAAARTVLATLWLAAGARSARTSARCRGTWCWRRYSAHRCSATGSPEWSAQQQRWHHRYATCQAQWSA